MSYPEVLVLMQNVEMKQGEVIKSYSELLNNWKRNQLETNTDSNQGKKKNEGQAYYEPYNSGNLEPTEPYMFEGKLFTSTPKINAIDNPSAPYNPMAKSSRPLTVKFTPSEKIPFGNNRFLKLIRGIRNFIKLKIGKVMSKILGLNN